METLKNSFKHRRKPKTPYTRDGEKSCKKLSDINAIGARSQV